MASAKAVQGLKHAKPIFSTNNIEARRRVLGLYRTWYRHLQLMGDNYDRDLTIAKATAQLRQEFEKNRHVKDLRVIDILCVKGQQELAELKNQWKQTCHLMYYTKDTVNPKPTDFMSKFLDGHDP